VNAEPESQIDSEWSKYFKSAWADFIGRFFNEPYALNIDHALCWGCRTCEVACKQEMNAPDGVRLIRVQEDGPKEVDGKLEFVFHVSLCRHCEAPPCAEACPEQAIYKRDDGIVVLEEERCTGCKACMEECPYEAIAEF
jgi:Fe-S-cluster-containing dehydrogenase component